MLLRKKAALRSLVLRFSVPAPEHADSHEDYHDPFGQGYGYDPYLHDPYDDPYENPEADPYADMGAHHTLKPLQLPAELLACSALRWLHLRPDEAALKRQRDIGGGGVLCLRALPPALAGLRQLRELVLEGCGVTSVPEALTRLTGLSRCVILS